MNMDHMNAALESIADLARTLKEERDAALADATALAERLTVLELTSTSELARLERERDEARGAIITTLEENRHLADGDDCTLAKLKSVVPDWK